VVIIKKYVLQKNKHKQINTIIIKEVPVIGQWYGVI